MHDEKHSDVVIAAEDAEFGLSEVNSGILPAGGASRAAAEDYLIAKQEQLWFVAGEEREAGFMQFLDDRTYEPGLGMYKRPHRE